ncbi:MAG: penicillin-binding transpeptidase domain-containing protein [Culicoidibacterales bacterium]
MSQRIKNLLSISKMRILIIIVTVFALFSLYVLQLIKLQFVDSQIYKERYKNSLISTFALDEPRGNITDAYGNVLVSNTPNKVISYIKFRDVDSKQTKDLAKMLSKYVQVTPDDVDESDLRDVYYRLNSDALVSEQTKITEDFKNKKNKQKNDYEQYEKQLKAAITTEQLETLKSDPEKFSLAFIEMKMSFASGSVPSIIKAKNVSDKEFAQVSERMGDMIGVEAAYQWNRTYLNGADKTPSLYGSITSSTQGLPLERKEEYLAKGYTLASRVGITGLEEYYQDYLYGKPATYTYEKDENGKYIKKLASAGKKGYNLKTTIDGELQKKTSDIVEDSMQKAYKAIKTSDKLTDVFTVVTEVKTGRVITLVGKHYDHTNGKFSDISSLAPESVYMPGSAVKAATISVGFQKGILKPGDRKPEIVYQLGSLRKASYPNYPTSSNNIVEALGYSSNTYMWQTILDAAGAKYVPNEGITKPKSTIIDEYRTGFSQFGLGIETGVDLPNEVPGRAQIRSTSGQNLFLPGEVMDFAIGQFDSYTPMQLSQYANTLANKGCRVQPHLVDEVYSINDQNQDQMIYQNAPKLQSCITSLTDAHFKEIFDGFQLAVVSPQGTSHDEFFKDGKYPAYQPVLKTGTAEIITDNRLMNSGSAVGWAPKDNPEISIAIIIPTYKNDADTFGYKPHVDIAKRVMDEYFLNNSHRKNV